MYLSNVCQTLSLVPMQLAWLARLVITRRDEAQLTLAFSCRCVMSNPWGAFSVHQLSPNVNSLDTARLQIPTVFHALTLCNSIRIVHRVLSCRSLSAASVLIVI